MNTAFSLVFDSDQSKQKYPRNTSSNFSYHLPQAITLDRNFRWRMGLKQITYPRFIFNIAKSTNFRIKFTGSGWSSTENVELPSGYYPSLFFLIKSLNEWIAYYANQSSNSRLREVYRDANPTSNRYAVKFFIVGSRVQLQVKNNIQAEFTQTNNNTHIFQALGFDKNASTITAPSSAPNKASLPVNETTVYAICDAIELVRVSDTLRRVFKELILTKNNSSSYFTHPTFIPLRYYTLTSINIKLVEEHFKPVNFSLGSTRIELVIEPFEEMNEHHHILLISNASMEKYPDNKPQEFTLDLAKPLNFENGKWEVAVTNVTYPNNFYTINSDCLFTFSITIVHHPRDEVNRFSFYVKKGRYTTVEALVDTLNKELNENNDIRDIIRRLADESFSRSDWSPEMLATRKLIIDDTARSPLKNKVIGFSYDKYTQRVKFFCTLYLFKVIFFVEKSDSVIRSLGFHAAENILGPPKPVDIYYANEETTKTPSLLHHSPSAYVTCDFVHEMPVGDKMVSLLHTFPLRAKEEDAIGFEEFQNPTFRPLSKSYIKQINISFTDDSGDLFIFPVGKTSLLLEFRRANVQV